MFIYKITNLINKKRYIGQTIISVDRRWQQHIASSKRINTDKRSTLIAKAISKYGVENFEIKQILRCNTQEELDKSEIMCIRLFKSHCVNGYGYNVSLGGNGKGKVSEETKKKLSEAQKRYIQIHGVQGIDKRKGKPAHNKGSKQPQYIKDNISATLKEYFIDHENPFKGKTHTAETIMQMSEVKMGKVTSEETKEKMRIAHVGKKIDLDTILKRQESRVKNGKPYRSVGDFVGYNTNGDEVVRFNSIKSFVNAGYSKSPLYKSINTGVIYKNLIWKKEQPKQDVGE